MSTPEAPRDDFFQQIISDLQNFLHQENKPITFARTLFPDGSIGNMSFPSDLDGRTRHPDTIFAPYDKIYHVIDNQVMRLLLSLKKPSDLKIPSPDVVQRLFGNQDESVTVVDLLNGPFQIPSGLSGGNFNNRERAIDFAQWYLTDVLPITPHARLLRHLVDNEEMALAHPLRPDQEPAFMESVEKALTEIFADNILGYHLLRLKFGFDGVFRTDQMIANLLHQAAISAGFINEPMIRKQINGTLERLRTPKSRERLLKLVPAAI